MLPARKKDGEDQAIGRSKGGLSTKVHATVDTLGNPTPGLVENTNRGHPCVQAGSHPANLGSTAPDATQAESKCDNH
jgi:hypothetical protein